MAFTSTTHPQPNFRELANALRSLSNQFRRYAQNSTPENIEVTSQDLQNVADRLVDLGKLIVSGFETLNERLDRSEAWAQAA